jgi:hypothetical protein
VSTLFVSLLKSSNPGTFPKSCKQAPKPHRKKKPIFCFHLIFLCAAEQILQFKTSQASKTSDTLFERNQPRLVTNHQEAGQQPA